MTSLQGNLAHTCDIQRATYTADTTGQLVPTWETVSNPVCRLIEKSERQPNPVDGFVVLKTFVLLLPASTDITTADRVTNIRVENGQTIQTTLPDGTVNNSTFDVVSVVTRRIRSRESHKSVTLELTDLV